MKLGDVAEGTMAVKTVSFRLANAGPAQPGQAPSENPAEFKLGLRVLTGDETVMVYEKAWAAAQASGVKTWSDEHPICNLQKMAHTLALAGIDVDPKTGKPADPANLTPCFEDADQIRESRLIGLDNIVFLYDAWVDWCDECSGRFTHLSMTEAIAFVIEDLKLKDEAGAKSPLVGLPRATLVTLVRTMGVPLTALLTGKSPSGLPETSSG